MKKTTKRILQITGGALAVIIVVFARTYASRLRTVSSIRKVTGYDTYNVYAMDISYDYSLDDIIDRGVGDMQSMTRSIVREALPYLPVTVNVPSFGCSVFGVKDPDGGIRMGRNYDFKFNTSAMMVHCKPKDGYESIAFAALDNISADDPQASMVKKLTCLAAPFICLDGMNEKGVSMAVLTLDSEPTLQSTGKPVIATSLAIRLVLDRAASTEEAIKLLEGYDMFAANGRDYHFFITDATGDSRVIEYDCDSEGREMVVTPTRSVTNFYIMHKDKVLPNQHNDPYGHGRERYDRMEAIFEEAGDAPIDEETAWKALKAAAQEPREGDVTSNTQWSILYDDTKLTLDAVLRRDWDTVVHYELEGNAVSVR